VINSCRDVGFKYVNTVTQPTTFHTLHKIQSPLKNLAGELIINFKKSTKPTSKHILPVLSITKTILNTAERIILKNNGATTDDIYFAIIPELLDAGLLDTAVKEVKSVTPILEKEFILGEDKKWYLREGTELGTYIPLECRARFYMQSFLKREGKATTDEIYLALLPNLANGRQPEKREILPLLEEIAKPTKEDKWKLKPRRTLQLSLPKKILPEETLPKIQHPKGSWHTEMIYRLVKLGKKADYFVWVGKREQHETFMGEKLSETSGVVEFPIKGIDKIKEGKIKEIDVIWFDKERPVWAFEVEEHTPIVTGIDRFTYLLEAYPDLAKRLVILAPERRRRKLNKELRESRYIGHPLYMENKIKYLFYKTLIEAYRAIEKGEKKIGVELLDSITLSPEINARFF
jgi:hypothetical protein